MSNHSNAWEAAFVVAYVAEIDKIIATGAVSAQKAIEDGPVSTIAGDWAAAIASAAVREMRGR